jgi:hypothetical protein
MNFPAQYKTIAGLISKRTMLKYSVIAVQNTDDELIYEIAFEESAIIQKNEERFFVIKNEKRLFRIASVTKVDHVVTPNDLYDYRLFALPL